MRRIRRNGSPCRGCPPLIQEKWNTAGPNKSLKNRVFEMFLACGGEVVGCLSEPVPPQTLAPPLPLPRGAGVEGGSNEERELGFGAARVARASDR